MKKRNFIFPMLCSVFLLCGTSCSGFKDWNQAGTSFTINYCLLQGQTDHNDSIERTRGARDYLGTRNNTDNTLNENVQAPKVNNNFVIYQYKDGKKTDTPLFKTPAKVTEIEHATMISTAGATWDSITANDTSTVWLNKHSADSWLDKEGVKKNGQSITMFVSNNDGMSLGALGSVMWPKGMPLFGFDANDNALEAIKNGYMTGTIDNNPISQVLACLMIIRNITDCTDSTKKFTDEIAFKNIDANHTEKDASGKLVGGNFGYINPGNIAWQSPEDAGTKESPRAYLSQGYAVTKNKLNGDKEKGIESDYEKLMKFFKDDGTVRTAVERIEKFEDHIHTATTPVEKRKVFMTYNSQTDTYFSSTMRPLFNELQGTFNCEITDFSGNGNDETACLDAFETNVNKEGYDAFIINMVKSSNASQYIEKLKKSKYFKDGKITVPVIFWNKQPTDVDGNIDAKLMHDDCFSFVCYVGIASRQGGQEEGKMVYEWVQNCFNGNDYNKISK